MDRCQTSSATVNSNSLVNCNEAESDKLPSKQNTKVLNKMHGYAACADPEWGKDRGSGPLEKSQNIGFLSKTGPDPLKNYKAT